MSFSVVIGAQSIEFTHVRRSLMVELNAECPHLSFQVNAAITPVVEDMRPLHRRCLPELLPQHDLPLVDFTRERFHFVGIEVVDTAGV